MPKETRPNIRSHSRGEAAEVASNDGEGSEKAKYVPPCDKLTDLFFGPELDLRDEVGREEREELAKSMCLQECEARFACLEFALTDKHGKIGVWGGMSQGERREFKIYLRRQGYRQLPRGKELRLAVNIFEGDDGSKESKAK